MAKLLIGLGNPGGKYEFTYHNAGAIVLSRIFEKASVSLELRRKDETGLFRFKELKDPDSGNFVFIQPKTYMNESGVAVRAALKFFSEKPENILILHDDSDLPLGAYKLSASPNTAGHHGLESIQKEIGLKNFARLRIGIRDPKEKKRRKAEEFVLKVMPKTKLKDLAGGEFNAIWNLLRKK